MKALFQDYIKSQMLVFPISSCILIRLVLACLGIHGHMFYFPFHIQKLTMVQVNIRPTPFRLVLKLYSTCLNMADERQILGLSNASNRNLENASTLHKTEDHLYLHIHLPLQTFTCCDITKIDLLPCLL